MTGVLIPKSEESGHGPMDIASSSPDSTKRLVIFIQLFLLFLRATSTNRFNKSALVCAEFNWLTNFIFLGFVCTTLNVSTMAESGQETNANEDIVARPFMQFLEKGKQKTKNNDVMNIFRFLFYSQ